MCHMSGRHDPNRMSTVELTKVQVLKRAKAIAKTKMSETWEWGKKPHDRENPVPAVSFANFHYHTFSRRHTFYADMF